MRVAVPTPKKAPVAAEGESYSYGTPAEELDMSRPHIMVATRGGQRLLSFASDYAKQLGAIMFVVYVRQWNVQFAVESSAPKLEDDEESRSRSSRPPTTHASPGGWR